MDAVSPSQLLANQHRQIDTGIKGIVDGTGSPGALAESLATLRAHLYTEEAILFPPLVKTGLTMPVFVMKREHGEMWPLLERLAAASMAADAAATLKDTGRRLFQLLQIHNTKEEEIVYTAADRYVAAHADDPLIAQLQGAKLPAGWKCAMAPR